LRNLRIARAAACVASSRLRGDIASIQRIARATGEDSTVSRHGQAAEKLLTFV